MADLPLNEVVEQLVALAVDTLRAAKQAGDPDATARAIDAATVRAQELGLNGEEIATVVDSIQQIFNTYEVNLITGDLPSAVADSMTGDLTILFLSELSEAPAAGSPTEAPTEQAATGAGNNAGGGNTGGPFSTFSFDISDPFAQSGTESEGRTEEVGGSSFDGAGASPVVAGIVGAASSNSGGGQSSASSSSGTSSSSSSSGSTGSDSGSGDSETTTTTSEPDPSIVVFDMTTGASSSHSNSFSADIDYTIYIRVPSAGKDVVAIAQPWGNVSALGQGDTIYFAGDSGLIQRGSTAGYGLKSNYVGSNKTAVYGRSTVTWGFTNRTVVRHSAWGNVRRTYNGDGGSAKWHVGVNSGVDFGSNGVAVYVAPEVSSAVLSSQGISA